MIRFEIRNVEESDLGEYRCHATNNHGYDNSIAKLTFECKRPYLESSAFYEANYRAFMHLDPVFKSLTFAFSAMCLFVSLFIMMNACGSPQFPCDTSLDSVREFIFTCMTDNCNLKPP